MVSQLNGSSFLFKNRLTRIKNSNYFNNVHTYMSIIESSHSYLLGLGANCAIFFSYEPIIERKKGGKCCLGDIWLLQGGNGGSWWIGRI